MFYSPNNLDCIGIMKDCVFYGLTSHWRVASQRLYPSKWILEKHPDRNFRMCLSMFIIVYLYFMHLLLTWRHNAATQRFSINASLLDERKCRKHRLKAVARHRHVPPEIAGWHHDLSFLQIWVWKWMKMGYTFRHSHQVKGKRLINHWMELGTLW